MVLDMASYFYNVVVEYFLYGLNFLFSLVFDFNTADEILLIGTHVHHTKIYNISMIGISVFVIQIQCSYKEISRVNISIRMSQINQSR